VIAGSAVARGVAAAALTAAAVLTPVAGAGLTPPVRPAAGAGPTAPARPAGDPLCQARYAGGRLRARPTLRFGIDPEPAGSIGATQNGARPVDPARTLSALRALRPGGRELVLRINRLFESAGEPGIRRVRAEVTRLTRAGFDVEVQVRYHPTVRQAGDLAAWTRYVRRVVDGLGPNPRVVAMTITNEVNVRISPNTSDGAYPKAEQALVRGVIAADAEARRRRFGQLRFGFTYAYGFDPAANVAMFAGLRAGGAAFRRALSFVGVDYYPELFPGRASSIPVATLQMLGTVRRCLMPRGGLGPDVPIWVTESGYDTTPGVVDGARQRRALEQIVGTIRRAARTFGVTDYRWFNLRDNDSSTTAFAETSGLLTDTYARKPAFAAYRRLIERYGSPPAAK
jgi:hypothetical protein